MKKILLYLIRFYRKYLSPMKVYTHCIYIPTCSEYALEAIEKYGAFKGGASDRMENPQMQSIRQRWI